MSQKKDFLILTDFNETFYQSLFSLADRLKTNPLLNVENQRGLFGALIFFEPSTRTRMSFEAASVQEGFYPLRLDSKMGSSLEKGETHEDTVLNIAAMGPKYFVIRCNDDLDLAKLSEKVNVPILNAGWGKVGHPTQALLDAYTLKSSWIKFENKKLLIVGDILHSRVASSHFQLAKILGYEVAVCGPQVFLPEDSNLKKFSNLEEGLSWCDSVIALRVQQERHDSDYNLKDYHSKYGLNDDSLKKLKSDGLILHPGPINHGVELNPQILSDSRCKIFEQVQAGVLIRQALIHRFVSSRNKER